MYKYYIYSERVQSCPQKKKKPKELATCACCDKTFPLTFVLFFSLLLYCLALLLLLLLTGLIWSCVFVKVLPGVCRAQKYKFTADFIIAVPCNCIATTKKQFGNLRFLFSVVCKAADYIHTQLEPFVGNASIVAIPMHHKDKHNMVCLTP